MLYLLDSSKVSRIDVKILKVRTESLGAMLKMPTADCCNQIEILRYSHTFDQCTGINKIQPDFFTMPHCLFLTAYLILRINCLHFWSAEKNSSSLCWIGNVWKDGA